MSKPKPEIPHLDPDALVELSIEERAVVEAIVEAPFAWLEAERLAKGLHWAKTPEGGETLVHTLAGLADHGWITPWVANERVFAWTLTAWGAEKLNLQVVERTPPKDRESEERKRQRRKAKPKAERNRKIRKDEPSPISPTEWPRWGRHVNGVDPVPLRVPKCLNQPSQLLAPEEVVDPTPPVEYLVDAFNEEPIILWGGPIVVDPKLAKRKQRRS